MKIKTAVGYARFSSDKQREESIMHQMEVISKFCDEKKIKLVDAYTDEAKSGTNMNRESFQGMLENAKTATWDYVIVYRMDRLSRNVMDALSTKKELRKLGIEIISVIENYDTDTPEGGFFNLISMGMSQFYVENLKREIMAGKMQNAKQAKHVGGLPAYGYDVDENLKYVINEKEAKAVKMIFQMVIDEYSYSDIAIKLNKLGYRTRFNNPFRGVFTDMLQNRKYIGEYVYNRIAKRKIDGKRNSHYYKPESEIVRIEGGVPAIIDKNIFEKVQEILRLRRHHQGYTKKDSKYLFTGMIRCGVCGFAVSGWTNLYGKNKYTGFYYACTHKSEGKRCGLKRIRMYKTNKLVIDTLNKEVLSLVNINTFINRMKQELVGLKLNLELQLSNKNTEVEDIKEQIKESSEGLTDARHIRRHDLMEYIGELESQLREKESEIESLEYDLNHLPRITKKYTVKIIKLLLPKLISNDIKIKRDVLFKIIQNMILDNENLTILINLKTFVETSLKNEWTASYSIDRNVINKLKKNDYIKEN